MVEIRKLTKLYGDEKALDDISIQLRPGEIIGLFGPNGAGKTTFIKSIFGFIKYNGSITLDGEAISRKNITRLSFATCEHSFFPNITAEEHAQFYRGHFSTFNEKRFNVLMDFFSLPKDKVIKRLSTGQQGQFEAIMALCQGADYIIMDEPFIGSDIFNREDFYKVILGMLGPKETVLISTHLIEEVSGFISRVILLDKGRIIGDISTAELEEQGKDLVGYVKENYNYRSDRVYKALDALEPQEG